MRTLWMAGLIAASSVALAQNQQQGQAAQQAPQQAPQQQQQSTPEDEKVKERIRAEGAAGGTAPLPEEKRQAVGAGLFKYDTAPFPTVRRIVDTCLQNEAFARAHPLRQPGAPQAA